MKKAKQNPDYNDAAKAHALAEGYATIDRWQVHGAFFKQLQDAAAAGNRFSVLDLGAGSGEDARIMAAMGHHVTAVEPADAMRAEGIARSAGADIAWCDEGLPYAASMVHEGQGYHAVLVSAVWQELEPEERIASLKTIARLAKPGAAIRLLFPSPPAREGQQVISAETFAAELALANQSLPAAKQLHIGSCVEVPDTRGRISITGKPVAFLEYGLTTPSRGQALENATISGPPQR